MSKKTLGQLVKQILSDADMDVVNNISDTEEALQVARIVISTFEEMVTRFNLPVEKEVFQLDATTPSTPTTMTIPSGITKVELINYDTRESFTASLNYVEVGYVSPEDFLVLSNSRNSSDSTVVTSLLPSGAPILVRNDVAPSCWTSFDNKTIVFDAYDSSIETNLQNSKTQCYGVAEQTIQLTEDAEIPLDPQLFSLLENKARATVFVRLKQTRDPSSEDAARRLEIKAQDGRWRQNGKWYYPGYGRWI
ncbi:MAG: hypothetical protein Unbinned5081contig1000_15 [Prokaryotic dsDNA virus sp.]|nr:MAG: hypothetical protein Unbinned5081contig1000_15 [Prokaryotic dsDNA virus sp.]